MNQIILGVIGRAQRRYGMPIHALVVMSNHFHLLASPSDGKRLADFMGFVNGNLSKEVGRFRGWRGPLWHRRYDSVPISQEEAAQVGRLRYLLAHGCKEGLVMSPADWPGAHCVGALLKGIPLKGIWYDRSKAYEARRRDNSVRTEEYSVVETVELSPLPAWGECSQEDYKCRVQELVQDISVETRARHRREGNRPLGIRAILNADTESRVELPKRPPKPLCHAASRKIRQAIVEHFRAWLLAYQRASESWLQGVFDVEFPPWSFRPGGGWVRGPDPLPV